MHCSINFTDGVIVFYATAVVDGRIPWYVFQQFVSIYDTLFINYSFTDINN